MSNKDGRIRKNVMVGMKVQVVQKQDQRTSVLTSGTIEEILTPSAKHPHGIKVRLRSGKIGRIKKILSIKKHPHLSDEETNMPEEPTSTKKNKKEKKIVMPWERH